LRAVGQGGAAEVERAAESGTAWSRWGWEGCWDVEPLRLRGLLRVRVLLRVGRLLRVEMGVVGLLSVRGLLSVGGLLGLVVWCIETKRTEHKRQIHIRALGEHFVLEVGVLLEYYF